MKKLIVILYNSISSGSLDEVDVLSQRDLVKEACLELGYRVECIGSGNDPMGIATEIWKDNPDMVFNLVESVWEKGELIYVLPAILNALRIPFTGVSLEALFLTTNKVLTKNMLRSAGLQTPDYFTIDQVSKLDPDKRYMSKPIWEEGSIGISGDPIFTTKNKEKMAWIKSMCKRHYFIEEYIEGREINVSLLAGKDGPEILPIAEITFSDYFKDKPKILDYKAKWVADSEEYKQTNRVFGTLETEPELEKKIKEMCLKVWDLFGLTGYARVDFRVDEQHEPYILEVNGNPCISPDSGFIAAVEAAAYSNKNMIKRIIDDAR